MLADTLYRKSNMTRYLLVGSYRLLPKAKEVLDPRVTSIAMLAKATCFALVAGAAAFSAGPAMPLRQTQVCVHVVRSMCPCPGRCFELCRPVEGDRL